MGPPRKLGKGVQISWNSFWEYSGLRWSKYVNNMKIHAIDSEIYCRQTDKFTEVHSRFRRLSVRRNNHPLCSKQRKVSSLSTATGSSYIIHKGQYLITPPLLLWRGCQNVMIFWGSDEVFFAPICSRSRGQKINCSHLRKIAPAPNLFL